MSASEVGELRKKAALADEAREWWNRYGYISIATDYWHKWLVAYDALKADAPS
jgi:hypothetical protein